MDQSDTKFQSYTVAALQSKLTSSVSTVTLSLICGLELVLINQVNSVHRQVMINEPSY